MGLVHPGVQLREEGVHPDHPQGSRACIGITFRMEFGIFFFTAVFSPPLPSLSLSFWPIFVFCRGSGVFLKQLFRRRLLSDGRSVGKSSLPPAIAPPTRPALLLLLLRAAAAFWSMQRNTAPEPEESSKNSLLQPPRAQLLPEGAMAKWVSPDLLQSPYAQWGPCFP